MTNQADATRSNADVDSPSAERKEQALYPPLEHPPSGMPVAGHYEKLVRFMRYKPNSQQRIKFGIIGRWQEWNGHGWTNCEAPDAWSIAEQSK